MTTVLVKQYQEIDPDSVSNKKLIKEFAERSCKAIIVPFDLNVEWIDEDTAVIKTYSNDTRVLTGAEKLQTDLLEQGIDAVILPANTDIEVCPA